MSADPSSPQPDSLSPGDIEATRFATRPRGYDKESVEAFLHRVAEEFRELLESGGEPYRRLGEEVGGWLQHAKDAADRIRAEAEREAAQVRRTAETTLERAHKEAADLKREAERWAEELRASAQTDAHEVLAESERLKRLARADATVVGREAERAAQKTLKEAEREAEALRESARREALQEVERSERKLRRLNDMEIALSRRLDAAESRREGASDPSQSG